MFVLMSRQVLMLVLEQSTDFAILAVVLFLSSLVLLQEKLKVFDDNDNTHHHDG